MGISYRCDATLGLTVSVWHGTVTSGDLDEVGERIRADPSWPAGSHFLTDVTTLANVSFLSDEMLAEMVERTRTDPADRLAGARWAVVASEAFWRARHFADQLRYDVRGIMTFNLLDTACAWLDVDAAVVRRIVHELRDEIRDVDARRSR
jgi:hypothetical protein